MRWKLGFSGNVAPRGPRKEEEGIYGPVRCVVHDLGSASYCFQVLFEVSCGFEMMDLSQQAIENSDALALAFHQEFNLWKSGIRFGSAARTTSMRRSRLLASEPQKAYRQPGLVQEVTIST